MGAGISEGLACTRYQAPLGESASRRAKRAPHQRIGLAYAHCCPRHKLPSGRYAYYSILPKPARLLTPAHRSRRTRLTFPGESIPSCKTHRVSSCSPSTSALGHAPAETARRAASTRRMPRSASDANGSPGSDASTAETRTDLSDESNDTANSTTEPGEQETRRNNQLSRRGHFKSRLGCFNCKRRKIKCNELRPSCSPCRRLGLSCNYPTAAQSTAAGVIRANPAPLALEDLQFYHRFLTRAFPTLPLRADELWARCASMTYQVRPPLFSHHCLTLQSECLAHAVLGLGASHLTTHGTVDYTSQALTHRVAAIKLVNHQFVNPPKDQDNADALFAALLCLCAQTSLLPDAMNEYLSITRAGALVWAVVMPHHTGSLFKVFTSEIHDDTLNGMASNNPEDLTDANDFWISAEKLKPLCDKPYQVSYQQCIANTILAVYQSSQRGVYPGKDLSAANLCSLESTRRSLESALLFERSGLPRLYQSRKLHIPALGHSHAPRRLRARAAVCAADAGNKISSEAGRYCFLGEEFIEAATGRL